MTTHTDIISQLISVRDDIPSSYEKFSVFNDYQVAYSVPVVEAIQELCSEYNSVFSDYARAHTEASTDYQFLRMDNRSDNFFNLFMQVDMAGLTESFLEFANNTDVSSVKDILRGRIFEIDDSLAMYNLMRDIHSVSGKPSSFKSNFDAALDELRERTGRPIAVLAVTEDKYRAIMKTELGILDGSMPTDAYVRNTIGFDKVFGPEEFKTHIEENNGKSTYLLYVRTSPPIDDLNDVDRDETKIELLGNHEYRRIIRANALTINIDNPWAERVEIVSDSKAALPKMGMGFRVDAISDIKSNEFSNWIEEQDIKLNTVLRAKPIYGTYGARGAYTSRLCTLISPGIRLENAIRKWGAYLLQPEIPASKIYNSINATTYGFIDRLFIYSRPNGSMQFIGGLRNCIPLVSREAKKNNYHGNSDAVWGEIVAGS